MLSVPEQLEILAGAQVPSFQEHLDGSNQQELTRSGVDIFQVNIGKLCNQRCHHCHVDAGPHRVQENMSRETIEACLLAIKKLGVSTVDITGGAPELHPHFRYFVKRLRELGVLRIIDRCNLTVLLLPQQKDTIAFLKDYKVEIVASLPAVNEHQTDAQRGDGIFQKSIKALKLLNEAGYGVGGSDLTLTLMSNPSGAFLPPPQSSAEQRFKRLLKNKFDVVFTNLIELTNMPISRYLDYLQESGNYQAYMEKLSDAFNPAAIDGLMCRNTLSVSWDGYLYDCDFNQMLELSLVSEGNKKRHVSDLLNIGALEGQPICVAKHCLGCTAGQGSSCGGATT